METTKAAGASEGPSQTLALVPEISAAHLPAALAGSVTFALVPWSRANQGQVFRDGAWTTP